jgi:CheY-like chemotaxis protein
MLVDCRTRVLLVDDLRDDTLMMGKLLIAHGCDIATCNDPRAACEVARQFRPNLVLLDIAMPGMSGFTVAEELRASDLPHFMLVARTGYTDSNTKATCMRSGFDLVVVKPVEASALHNILSLARSLASARVD